MHAIFRHDYPLAVEPASTPRPLVQKGTLRDSVPIDMLLSAVSVLVVAQSISEVPEGLMNNPVHRLFSTISRYVTCICGPKEMGITGYEIGTREGDSNVPSQVA